MNILRLLVANAHGSVPCQFSADSISSEAFMRHFSCDHCGKDLTEPTEARYVLRMESYAITPSEPLTESALDTDHAELLADVLENIPSESHRFLQDQDREPREYDLCPSCFHRFRADPFGQENAQKLHFSSN